MATNGLKGALGVRSAAVNDNDNQMSEYQKLYDELLPLFYKWRRPISEYRYATLTDKAPASIAKAGKSLVSQSGDAMLIVKITNLIKKMNEVEKTIRNGAGTVTIKNGQDTIHSIGEYNKQIREWSNQPGNSKFKNAIIPT